MADTGTTPGETLVASIVFLTLGAAILAFVSVGWQEAALVLALGWLVVLPLTAILTEAVGPLDLDHSGRRKREAVPGDAAESDADTALDALRERYARGDIDEAEFERRVERLLETEDPERAAEAVVDDLDRETEREL